MSKLTADEMVEMSLDDIIKASGQNKKGGPKPGAGAGGLKKKGPRKPVKQNQGGTNKKPGQVAQQSAAQAQNKRNAAFNKTRGIQNKPNAQNVVAGGNKKGKKKIVKVTRGGVKVNIGGKKQGGGGQPHQQRQQGGGGKRQGAVTGNLQLPDGFQLPAGTTLKISIATGGKATVSDVRPPPIKQRQPQQQQQGGGGRIVGKGSNPRRNEGPRVGLKAIQVRGQAGAGNQARRFGQTQGNQQKRQNLFNSGRGLVGGISAAGGRGAGVKGGSGKRKVIIRRKMK